MALWLWVFILTALAVADREAGPQSLFSQPLFIGILTGTIAGDVLVGLQAGLLMQLCWPVVLPAGNALYPETAGATIVVTALASGIDGIPMLGALVLYGIGIAELGKLIIAWTRSLNQDLRDRSVEALKAGNSAMVEVFHAWGSLLPPIFAGTYALLAYAVATRAIPIIKLPSSVEKTMTSWTFLLLLVGAGIILSRISDRRLFGLAVLGYGVGVLIW